MFAVMLCLHHKGDNLRGLEIAMHRGCAQACRSEADTKQALTGVVPDSPDDTVLAGPHQGKANNGTNCRGKQAC